MVQVPRPYGTLPVVTQPSRRQVRVQFISCVASGRRHRTVGNARGHQQGQGRLRAAGEPVIGFGAGEPDFATPSTSSTLPSLRARIL